MKIIQIAASARPANPRDSGNDTLYALTDTGRVAYWEWITLGKAAEWRALPDIPAGLFDVSE